MPYAHEGRISHDPIEGGVEVTEQQYSEALAAILEGEEVTIDGGFAIRDKQPSEFHEWEGGEWVDKTPDPEPVPENDLLAPLTRRQLRLGLLANGITTATVEAAIAAIHDPMDRAVAEIEWADASTYERNHHLVEMVGTAIGLTPEQIDTMWEAALQL